MASRHIEYYLQWCWQVLHAHGAALSSTLNSMAHLESVRALIRAISAHEREVMKMSDENLFSLHFLVSQMVNVDVPPTTPTTSTSTALVATANTDTATAEEDWVMVEADTAATETETAIEEAVKANPETTKSTESTTTTAATPTVSVALSEKKSKKSSKKLTIETATGRENVLEAANAAVAVTVSPTTPCTEPVVEETATAADVVLAEESFATPGKAKKQTAKSACKSALKSSHKAAAAAEEEGDRRVSFSHPLSMVKYISPISRTGKHFQTPTTGVGGKNSSSSSTGKKSGSKKRLWAEEA